MYIAFLVLFLAAIAVNFIRDRLDLRKLDAAGPLLGLAAGIILAVAVCRTQTESSANPYFLGTFIAFMSAGVSMAVGYGLAEWMKKRKK